MQSAFIIQEKTEPGAKKKALGERGPPLGRPRANLEFRLSRSKSAIAQRLANVHTRTATVAGDQL